MRSAVERKGYERSRSLAVAHALFMLEFGRGFYGNTYTSVLSGLTLTPGPLQIFVTRPTTLIVQAREGKLGGRG